MLFCNCEFCGKKRMKIFSKSYPSIWSWRRYYFCSLECANNLVKADGDEAGKCWQEMLEAFVCVKE